MRLAVLATLITASGILPAAAQTTAPQAGADTSPYFLDRPELPRGRSQSEAEPPRYRTPAYTSQRPAPEVVAEASGQPAYRSAAYPGARVVRQATAATPVAASRPQRAQGRIEIRGGWDHVTLADTNGDDYGDGLTYGVASGYDVTFGKWFVGGFAGVDWSTAEIDSTLTVDTSLTTSDDISLVDTVARDIELGVRAGIRLNERLAIYALGAFTNIHRDIVTQTVTTTSDPADPTAPPVSSTPITVSTEESQDGWRAGAGTEVTLFDRVFAKAEYRYSDYGTSDSFGDELARHQVLTGLGLRF